MLTIVVDFRTLLDDFKPLLAFRDTTAESWARLETGDDKLTSTPFFLPLILELDQFLFGGESGRIDSLDVGIVSILLGVRGGEP